MKKFSMALVFASAAILSSPALATSSHCKSGEFDLLSAELSSKNQKSGALKNNGKVVSLCADRAKEPFSSVAYRFGKVGAVELEKVATPQNVFFISNEMTGPRMGQNIVHFNSGDITYYVVEGTGMARGVGLYVFRSGKILAEMLSDMEEGRDFTSNLGEVDFEKAKSQVFKIKKAKDPLLGL